VNVSPEAWRRLLAASASHVHDPGAVLLRQGDAASHVLVIVKGRVKVFWTAPDGTTVVLAIRGPGEILGDITVLGGGSRSATVIAVDHCETRIIPADRFTLLVRSLHLENEIFQHAMARVLECDSWRADAMSLPAGVRLARALLRLSSPSSTDPPDVSLDQTEVGQAAGLARSTVAAELARLREVGIITTRRRRIVITDIQRLRTLASTTGSPDDPGAANV
jgi:CRP/FNR family transcriptional regulator, cyclic AMP receptor protein